ncbi:CHY zinc finger protein [Staphylococcus sp. SQ8-PEA]|uniref:CHY zinc finger protein n=1 Tax=Staphylococcus marylandisciuri TaxID=2981529 RepID=A0ABT2QPB1_9STAP|nr:CHY zinc finger protein [Staphylococcus marylandisciuri]MCU5745821.1 CHY zinc finger protein [Staphylococcus marylandisciuri]
MVEIYGNTVDNEARCTHYHSMVDIIAIKFKCCNKYYPCYKCHEENEKHMTKRWSESEFDQRVVLCGVCQYEMKISEYMMSEACPNCASHFNTRCLYHYHHYFEI